MSAINGFVRSDAAFLMSDGLSYLDGIADATLLNKTHRLCGINAVVAATGPAQFGEWLAGRLVYKTFDGLIETADWQIKRLFERYAREYRNNDAVAGVVLAGWHEKDDRPALYAIDLETSGSPTAERIAAQDNYAGKYAAADLMELTVTSAPVPTRAEFAEAGYDLGADFERVDPATYLLHLTEIQRHAKFGGEHVVGGQAVLTTITRDGTEQRVVHTWPDEPGKPVVPEPIDWTAWRAAREKPMSRLKRQIAERKKRKRS